MLAGLLPFAVAAGNNGNVMDYWYQDKVAIGPAKYAQGVMGHRQRTTVLRRVLQDSGQARKSGLPPPPPSAPSGFPGKWLSILLSGCRGSSK